MSTTPASTRKRGRTALTTTLGAVLMVAGLGLGTVPAHATPPPGPACNPDVQTIWDDITSATVTPKVTEFSSFNVAPGTTGQRTETLTEQENITTSINSSTEFNASYKSTLAEVGVKVGFSVTTGQAHTRITDRTRVLNLNAPGHYGLYRGALQVTGEWSRYLCARSGPGTGYWVNSSATGKGYYVTFGAVDEGTVECTQPMPVGTVRWAAQQQLCRN
ncbi:hypothetical protein ACFVFS_32520 [Kitasatospora sp. NPDC057692]|uniref:hypothetical protein n=1 Tax=Kitasatospora sp. NPDC057692 TaxID=3346215 RepID=UPI00368BF360